jgi:hypothetical protein
MRAGHDISPKRLTVLLAVVLTRGFGVAAGAGVTAGIGIGVRIRIGVPIGDGVHGDIIGCRIGAPHRDHGAIKRPKKILLHAARIALFHPLPRRVYAGAPKGASASAAILKCCNSF